MLFRSEADAAAGAEHEQALARLQRRALRQRVHRGAVGHREAGGGDRVHRRRPAQQMLGPRMGRDVFFYSVTLQPEQDTVPILKEYAEDIFEVKPGWLFLTGKQEDIDRLRRAQGFYDPDPERDADVTLHSSSARIGSDLLQRWNMVSLGTSPRNIYTSIASL